MHVDMVDHNPLLHFYLAPSVSLLDAIEVQQDSRVTFCDGVKEVSEILTNKNRDGAEKRYRRVVVGRGPQSRCQLHVQQCKYFDKLIGDPLHHMVI